MSRAIIVCVGGPPGGGKSTAGRAVAAALELTYHSAGTIFREEAARRGLDLEAFGRLAEQHPEIDRAIDETMSSLAKPGSLLDGRIQGVLLRRQGVPVQVIVITAREAVRAQRVARRDGQALGEATERIREREASEHRRYLREYSIDLEREPADLVIDSSDLTPAEVQRRMLDHLAAHGATRAP